MGCAEAEKCGLPPQWRLVGGWAGLVSDLILAGGRGVSKGVVRGAGRKLLRRNGWAGLKKVENILHSVGHCLKWSD